MVGKDYDEFDLRDARNVGFWTGALAGFGSALLLFACVGWYIGT